MKSTAETADFINHKPISGTKFKSGHLLNHKKETYFMVKKDSSKISQHHHTISPLVFFSYSYWRSGKKGKKIKKRRKKSF